MVLLSININAFVALGLAAPFFARKAAVHVLLLLAMR
jgi:hypothetical protein